MARPGSGPSPAWPGTGPSAVRPGAAQPGFQPNGARGADRHAERPDWTERTERIDRVTASGYPDPRASGRGNPPGASGGFGAPGTPVASGLSGAPGAARGRGDPADRYLTDPRGSTRTSGGWASPDDDPLTSKAYSRAALVDTDGRSYRVARRSQASARRREAALTEETQTFNVAGQYQADAQPAAGRYPAYGAPQPGQPPGPLSAQQSRQPAQPQRTPLPPGGVPGSGGRNPYDRGAASSYPYSSQPYPSRPALEQDEERYGRPPRPSGYGGNSNGDYDGGYGNGGSGGYGNGGYGGYGNGSWDNGRRS